MVSSLYIKGVFREILIYIYILAHLDEGIYVSDGWNVIRNEGLQFCFQFLYLRREARDVRKKLFDLGRYRQILVIFWIICPFHFRLD